MSDFLNFNVQDEILNGDPEFDIVQKANGKYEIDLATEVIQEGTDLNKLTFDKLKVVNQIMGYNKSTANIDEDNWGLNYNTDVEKPINDYSDGERLLIFQQNEITPISEKVYTTLKNSVVPLSQYDNRTIYFQSEQVDDNEILTIFKYDSNTTYIETRYIDSGEIKASNTISSSNFLSPVRNHFNYLKFNNKYLIWWVGLSNSNSEFMIFDENLQVIKSKTSYPTSSSGRQNQFYLLFPMYIDNKIYFVGGYSSSSYGEYFMRYYAIDELGNIVEPLTNYTLTSGYHIECINKTNDNKVIIGCSNSNAEKHYYEIYDIVNKVSVYKSTLFNNRMETELPNECCGYYNLNCLVQLKNNNFFFYNINTNKVEIIQSDLTSVTQLDNRSDGHRYVYKDDNYIYVCNSGYYSSYNYNILIFSAYDGSYIGTTPYTSFIIPKLKFENKYNTYFDYSSYGTAKNYLQNQNITYKETLTSVGLFNAFINNDKMLIVVGKTEAISGNIVKMTLYFYTTYLYGGTFNYVKLDGKDIETMLNANKYYELVYNADDDKFIADEVRT